MSVFKNIDLIYFYFILKKKINIAYEILKSSGYEFKVDSAYIGMENSKIVCTELFTVLVVK